MRRRSDSLLLPLVTLALPVLLASRPLVGQQPLQHSAQPTRPVSEAPAPPSAAELAAPPPSAQKLASGISTRELRPGTGKEHVRAQDVVHFRSIGRRADGTVIQNTFGGANPQKILVTKLLPAWREALEVMVAGEQRRFWFPAAVAPKNPKTGAEEPLVFDVELESIGRMPDPPKSLHTPDPKAHRTSAGASVLVLKPGDPKVTVRRSDAALVNFTLWNELGQPLLSSIADGRPTLFPLSRVMAAFSDCLEGMTKGEQRLCWIPAGANQGFPGAPRGALTFELELLGTTDAEKFFSSPPTPPSHP